ncbi:T-complex protein 1 subunit eta-like [Asparagus officinalis]|uniref:T-complex protein 1 subunit eta-like n=1 Tax=Asparagus officinalis TaxID=4686 RepID=UPI00098E6906|nr:T-complex protein 1 subunit eta-like [Asparagus officinalis]
MFTHQLKQRDVPNECDNSLRLVLINQTISVSEPENCGKSKRKRPNTLWSVAAVWTSGESCPHSHLPLPQSSWRSLLAKCAATTLSSKLIGGEKEFFAEMVVDAVLAIVNDDRLNLLGIKKVPGGTMRDSFLVNCVAFKKTFSYASFEQQPKKFLNPKILLLNIELELKSEKENAEIKLSDPLQYQSIVDAEWKIIYDKLDKCVKSGAKIVLSRLAIGDLATQYFVDRDIFCNGI